MNMVVLLRNEPAAFDREEFPEWVWLSNLFGRATHNLVLAEELRKAYDVVDRELKVVADIQRSLLPKTMPAIPRLGLAAHYQTSQWAGGDYYDFFAAARRPLGHPDRRRQRPRHARGRHDGDHCTASPTRCPGPPTRRRSCSSTSTSTSRPATRRRARRSSRPSTGSSTPPAAS